MEKVTRRKFLKVSAAALVGGVAAYAGLGPGRKGRTRAAGADEPTGKMTVVPTFCEMCFWKCGVLAYRRGDKLVKIEGNPAHPLSNGMLCPRGVGGVGAVYDPDRLREPLIRVKEGDTEKWKVASWDEALDFTARRLLEVREKYGAGSLALYSHGHGGSFFKTLIKAYGSGIIAAPSYDQCRGPRATGYYLTYGETIGSPERIDTPNARCIALLGSHLGENMHNTPVQDISIANARGCTFITVDPRMSIIAGKSKYWLPIRPGTDIALLLAWAHVMINEGIYQKEFVQNNVYGFDEFKEYVADYTPEWAYTETGIKPDLIRETARELAKNAPAAFVHPGRHVVWYGDDTQRSRLIGIVNALLGNWRKRGGFYRGSQVKIAKYKLPEFPESKVCDCSSIKAYPLAAKVLAQGVCDASAPSTELNASIRSWIVYGCNVPTTLPDTKKVTEVMEGLDFVVAIDTMPAEVTGYADVILPECTYLERYDDLHNPSYHTPYVAIRQPVIKPLYNTKPGWWIAKQLAAKMDRQAKKMNVEGGFSKYYPWKNVHEYLKTRMDASGLSLEQLKKDGVIRKKRGPRYDNRPTLKFDTPTGKIEFVSTELAKLGLPALPPYTKHEEPPEGYFRLLTGRAPVHTFTRTTNNPRLLEVMPENEVWLNTEMARILGLENGRYVMLENQDQVRHGPIKLKVTERMRQDCVFMVHGFGRTNKPSLARAGYALRGGAAERGASDSMLMTRYKVDPIMGGTGMNVNFVRIIRA